MYEECFPKFKIRLILSPWTTKGIKKSSKGKQKLYEKFLKKQNVFIETAYKVYKTLFEAIKRKSKKNHYSQNILQFKYDTKKRWTVMKEIIGTAKQSKKSNFPQKLKIGNKIKTGEDEIANEFNKYFADIGSCLAKNIPDPSMPFKSFLRRVNTTLPSQSLSITELKNAFFSLKTNKSSGADKINFNVIKHCFGKLCGPRKYLFDSSLQSGVFPDLLKIAIVSPVFKPGDIADISNYRPISVVPCFSKILDCIMYNRLYKYLTDQKILHPQQFGFRKGHSTEQAIAQLVSTNHLRTATIPLAFLSTCQRRLIQSIMQYF